MKKEIIIALTSLVILTGCQNSEGIASSSPPVTSQQLEEDDAILPPEFIWLPDVESLDDLSLAQFTQDTIENTGTIKTSYTLLENTPLALEVQMLTGPKEGPLIYIVGGIHGDELAGFYAGILLEELQITAGTVCILSPANVYGAEQNQRKTKDGWDLNRAFPGDSTSTDVKKIAAAIYGDIAEKQPVFVLDLHEARDRNNSQDNLTNSIIFQSTEGIEDLMLDIMIASEEGTLCASPLSVFHAPPQGSINQTVTENLGIPTITIETHRGEPLQLRIFNQLDLVLYILSDYKIY